MKRIRSVDKLSEEVHGAGGFLAVHRLRLRNRYDDGSQSEPYLCDYALRSTGVDAVAVVLWRRSPTGAEVLLRRCLRPPISLGREVGYVPVAGSTAPLELWEVVAGIIEPGDRGEAGIRERAAIEAHEEAGYRVGAEAVSMLGAPFYASPGSLSEKVYAAAIDLTGAAAPELPPGDGSPMEEAAATEWVGLSLAIARCEDGSYQDLKTEVLLRRLAARLTLAP